MGDIDLSCMGCTKQSFLLSIHLLEQGTGQITAWTSKKAPLTRDCLQKNASVTKELRLANYKQNKNIIVNHLCKQPPIQNTQIILVKSLLFNRVKLLWKATSHNHNNLLARV